MNDNERIVDQRYKIDEKPENIFTAMTFVGFLFLITQETPYFVITYITTMFSMFTITTLTYDEFENGSAFLFSLPFSKKRLCEREISIWNHHLCLRAGNCDSGNSCCQCNKRTTTRHDFDRGNRVSFNIHLYYILSLSIPIEIKFGGRERKNRLSSCSWSVLCGFSMWQCGLPEMKEDSGVQNIISKIEDLSSVAVIGGVIGIWIIVGLISVLISMGLISRKEY